MDQLLPGLHRWTSRLSGPHQPVNSYLWNSPRGVVLIDPAADLTPGELERHGLGAVSDILVTHFQEENVAGCANFPAAKVHVPRGDEYLARGEQAYHAVVTPWPDPWDWTSRGNYTGHLGGARNERPTQQTLTLDTPLDEGEHPIGCRVVATPGHGKHAVTLLAPIAGRLIAFCGDVVFGEGKTWNWFDCEWDYGLQSGQRALLESVRRLRDAGPQLLCPTHGPVIDDPSASLRALADHLTRVLNEPPGAAAGVMVNFPDEDSPAPGFRRILPRLHQWRTGNCAVLVSSNRRALLVDDGLCHWVPLPQRRAHHRQVIVDLKRMLDIERIDTVIPTHYHGDHTENIPDLVAMENAEVVCLDTVAEPILHPERYHLACPLPWYGTAHRTIPIHRLLRSGQKLRWCEYELELFHLGGQTFYSLGVAVNVEGVRTLFVGDAIGGFGVGCDPVICYNDAEPTERGWAYALDRMYERQPDLLVCGHGIAVRNPMPLLERKRSAWAERLRQFDELLARANRRLFFDPYYPGLEG